MEVQQLVRQGHSNLVFLVLPVSLVTKVAIAQIMKSKILQNINALLATIAMVETRNKHQYKKKILKALLQVTSVQLKESALT